MLLSNTHIILNTNCFVNIFETIINHRHLKLLEILLTRVNVKLITFSMVSTSYLYLILLSICVNIITNN